MIGLTIDKISIGQNATMSKIITEADVAAFAEITGDFNPAHMDEDFAKNTIFKGRIAHGMLAAGLISAVLGMHLPGPGSIYMKQDLKFTAPVRFGDTITATVTVKEMLIEKNRITLDCIVTNQDGTAVLSGEALIMPPK